MKGGQKYVGMNKQRGGYSRQQFTVQCKHFPATRQGQGQCQLTWVGDVGGRYDIITTPLNVHRHFAVKQDWYRERKTVFIAVAVTECMAEGGREFSL